jgi:sensor histidine kinase YesM
LNTSSIFNILKHPNENGITIFVLGVMFILSVYHFFLYFQHKDKTYLYYSSYTFLIFIGLLNRPINGFIAEIIKPFKDTLDHLSLNLILNYNMVYFIFILTLLDMKAYSIRWNNFILKYVFGLFFFTILIEIGYQITGNFQVINGGHFFFLLATYLLGITSFIPVFRMKNHLKYYIIIGSLFLFITTLLVSIIKRLDLTVSEKEIRYSIFYFGLIIENIFFSLALGAKQKRILQDKNSSQDKLIKQLKENVKLRSKVHRQLEQNVATLSKQAEVEKLEALKAKYDKELAELKMTSLRSQMNPHFIFNSLNSIKSYIIDNKKENAVYYLNKFSKLIRKILAATMEREISLADEIETMELYVNIENIRFDNQISYSVTVDESLNINTLKIPSLILQPFIENAIWHGLASKEGDKKLDIKVKKEAHHFVKITITDNGVGRKRSAEINKKKIHKRNSIGIKLTEERLRNFAKDYHNNYSLTFKDLYDKDGLAKGTEVILKIPFK